MALEPATLAADRAALRERWYREGYFLPETLSQALRRAARERPDTRFHFHTESGSLSATTREIVAAGECIAAELQSLGIRGGDVIAIQLPTRLETAVLYIAALRAGATLLPIVHTYGPADVGFLLRQSRARMYVVPETWRGSEYGAERLAALGSLPDLEHRMVVGGRAPAGAITWSALQNPAHTEPAPVSSNADDVCLLLYTSGTTAEPKGVRHTHNSVRAEWMIPFITGEGPYFNPFPAGHIAGFNFMLRPMLTGMPMVFVDRWDARKAAELIQHHRVRQSGGTPFHLMSLLQAARETGYDLGSLESYALGGTGVTAAHVALADSAGFAGGRSYGLTEHSTVSAFARDMTFDKRAYSDGKLQPGTEVRIVDDRDCDVPYGAEGEVLTRGPELFAGYSDSTLDCEAFAAGGWFRTGDIGRLDADRYLTITDRKKDIIIRGGENISSSEVEAVLVLHAGVQEAAVVAMPDERYGEKVCAFVVVRPGAMLDLTEVQAHFASAGIARQKTPEALRLIDELPRTASGKVRKGDLRARISG